MFFTESKTSQIDTSFKFVKQIFNGKPFSIERYIEYKEFKRQVEQNLFKSRIDCIEFANKICPGLGFTEPIGKIITAYNLQ